MREQHHDREAADVDDQAGRNVPVEPEADAAYAKATMPIAKPSIASSVRRLPLGSGTALLDGPLGGTAATSGMTLTRQHRPRDRTAVAGA